MNPGDAPRRTGSARSRLGSPARGAAPSPVGSVLRWGWLGLVVVVVVFPVVVTVATAAGPENVRAALAAVPLGRQYLVSVAVTLVQTGAQLVTSALAAYALVFPRWRGRAVVFGWCSRPWPSPVRAR